MPADLTGRVIIITGASSGIGAATAVECARAGMHVVLNARRADRLEEVRDRVTGFRREAVTVIGDVTEPGISGRLLDAAHEAFGRHDAVFANAGHMVSRSIVNGTEDELRTMMDVHLFAVVDLLQAAARRLAEQSRPGHLLVCSSCLSKFSLPYFGAYAAAKAAQDAVCRAMRLEHAGEDLYVSSVHPVTTETEFFDVGADLSGIERPDKGVPNHSTGLFVQPPERVARAVVRCLRRPRPEVWTSHIVRTVAGVMTAFPRLADFLLLRQTAAERKALRAHEERRTR
ncbi:MAG: SDR family NAD(P)-dependent oxidoreductase [Planctomycetes bacterium]|nr:SDR family NAD(P)-dependent oxidoreductase [Planctomycetota bacterium]